MTKKHGGRQRYDPVSASNRWGGSPDAAILDRHIMPALVPLLPWSNVPPPGVEAAAEPLGRPPAGNDSGSFRLQESPGPRQDFVTYGPYRPVHCVIRPENSPVGGEVLIRQAVAEISAASGQRFVFDGPTAEGPSKERTSINPNATASAGCRFCSSGPAPRKHLNWRGMWAAWVAATKPTLSGAPSSTWPDK